MVRHSIFALFLSAAVLPVLACSPPEQRQASGFVRAQVSRLPKNALGVMFAPPAGKMEAGDFRITSGQDKRPLVLRVRTIKNSAWVRLEPAHGFQPGAQYQIRYVPKHDKWKYPDEINVTIDPGAVSSSGKYAIELAPRRVHRVVIVPTSSGSCVEPTPAVVQEFAYKVPPALVPYRDALQYRTMVTFVHRPPRSRAMLVSESWRDEPTLYDMGEYSLGEGFSKKYNARDNALIASCATRWRRIKLNGFVSFPELDGVPHATPLVEIDGNGTIEGKCNDLEALVQTVDWKAPEPSLRELCRGQLVSSFSMGNQSLRAVDPGEWEFQLSFFYGMSPTCNLVALAHLWHTGQYSTQPKILDQLGRALSKGMKHAKPAEKDAAVHALNYLVGQLPTNSRSTIAQSLLAPVLPALVEEFTRPQLAWPDDIASLIAHSGYLPTDLRFKVQNIAAGNSPAAYQARKILATGKLN